LALDEERSFVETSHYETNSPYSASKAASDCFVRAFYKTYGVPTVITNCSNNYGPNQHKEKLVPKILKNAAANLPIPIYGTGLNVRDWLYVEDHCHAIDLVLNKGQVGERYNIGGGVELSNIEMVHKILDILDKPHSLIEYVTDRAGHDLRYSIDCTKIKEELGYTANYSLEKGLEKTINWYLHDQN
jgi:dTDP-glucose 4,6-dehydratase